MFACLYVPPSAAQAVPREALERIARDFSPRIEMPSDAVVLLDISGLQRLLGGPRVIGEELRRALACVAQDVAQDFSPAHTAGLKTCATSGPHIAIAGTRVAAQLMARANAEKVRLQSDTTSPELTVIERGAEAAVLASLPLCSLGYLNAPQDLLATLERWGLRTLGEFVALPSNRLAARLGQQGLVWQRIASGEDQHPLVPTVADERFEETLDLEWPIEGVEPLAFVMGRLLDALCARLERRDRAAAAIELRLRLTVSRAWQTRRLELPAPMRDPRMLRTLLCLDLEGRPPDASVDRVGLFIEPTPGRVTQYSLLARPTVAPDEVTTLMARLRALMGQDRCGTARLADTHRPGAFVMGDFTGGSDRPTRDSSLTLDLKIAPGTPAFGPHRRALRRLRHPIPARVAVEHGRPVRVVTDRHGWSGGRVTWCAGPWRASGDWWRARPEDRPLTLLSAARSSSLDRAPYNSYNNDEWDVSLSDGGNYRIHEDREQSHWFVDAVLD